MSLFRKKYFGIDSGSDTANAKNPKYLTCCTLLECEVIIAILQELENTPQSVGGGISLVDADKKIKSLLAGTGISIVDNGDGTITITSTSGVPLVVVANYSALPPAGSAPGTGYIVLASQGTSWLWGSLGGTYYPEGFYYDNGISYTYTKSPFQATQADVDAGLIDNQFVTPLTLKNSTQWNTKVSVNTSITGATKTKITYDAKGLVTSGADATTADIADSSNKRYVSDANLVVLNNTSGTNTGDNATNTTSNSYADTKVAQTIINGVTSSAPSQDAVFDALALKANITDLPVSNNGYRKFGTTTFERWYTSSCNSSSFTTITVGRNNIQYMPLIVGKTCTLASIGINVTAAGTAGSLMTISIYDSVNNIPTNRVVDCGTLLVDSISVVKITGLSVVLQPGLYWFAINHNSVANVTMTALAVASCEPILGVNASFGIGTFYTNTSSAYTTSLPSTAVTPTTIGTTTPPIIYFYLSA